MSIARETSSLFSPVARERGRDVFNHRAISIVRGDAWSVTCSTTGTTTYLIDLSRNNANHITARCTCAEFAGRELCRHVWAALLLTEKKELLKGPGGRPHRVTLSADFDSVLARRGRDAHPDLDGSAAVDDQPDHETEAAGPLTWREQLALLRAQAEPAPVVSAAYRPSMRQILYVFDIDASRSSDGVILHLGWQDRRMTGEWGRLQTRPYLSHELAGALDVSDLDIITVLEGAASSYIREVVLEPPRGVLRNHYHLSPTMLDLLWPRLKATGRTMLRLPGPTPELPVLSALSLDDGPPWEPCLDVRETPGDPDVFRATLRLRRGDDSLAVTDQMALVKGAFFFHDTLARLDDRGVLPWMQVLRRNGGSMTIPREEAYAFVHDVVALPRVPHLLLPESLRLDDTRAAPECILRLQADRSPDPERPLTGALLFDYQGHEVSWADTSERVLQQEPRRLLVRDPVIERGALDDLIAEGVRVGHRLDGRGLQLEMAATLLPSLVRTLTARGWRVEAANRRYRPFTGSHFMVTSGIDWFELEGRLEFGEASVSLAALLANVPRGESFVLLDDGTMGVIPEEWLAKRELLQLCGGQEEDRLRFSRGQAVLLDQLLARQREVTVDEPFSRLREALRHFDGVESAEPPDTFHGTLRPYQREGLGWLLYLQAFGFGGCLADDMGLGKTVQVLALFAARHAAAPASEPLGPSLVVVPRSLIHNWQEEAARFVPSLRVLDHTGTARPRDPQELRAYHVVLTTYGTLLRDVTWLADLPFDCVVLDEAHAIKNAYSETARAVRLLRGRQRLALTGTPVQNHVGELWSLFDFLNPGLLGTIGAFERIHEPSSDPESRRILAQTFRPFLLRRTKSQVAADLPPKVEQTIHCELEGAERDFYDQLRLSYRESILSRVDREGLGRSRMFILEGLLRLRQAACHPGLLDPGKSVEGSAKLDMLLEQLREIVDEGHKAIVFSQFVRLLDIARLRLDREGLMYASLDGRTRHRGMVVDQFQRDPACRIFLVSLKAGGLGLNLTAADYVFLLDPWWNPAIEAQAIDRTHRIGQTRQVFAYRLIAKDTIDEKVLELQQRKQELADAIIGKGDELMQRLTREDLERLLS